MTEHQSACSETAYMCYFCHVMYETILIEMSWLPFPFRLYMYKHFYAATWNTTECLFDGYTIRLSGWVRFMFYMYIIMGFCAPTQARTNFFASVSQSKLMICSLPILYVIVRVHYIRIYGSKPPRPRAKPRGQGWFTLP